jgi:hypothetical protein
MPNLGEQSKLLFLGSGEDPGKCCARPFPGVIQKLDTTVLTVSQLGMGNCVLYHLC